MKRNIEPKTEARLVKKIMGERSGKTLSKDNKRSRSRDAGADRQGKACPLPPTDYKRTGLHIPAKMFKDAIVARTMAPYKVEPETAQEKSYSLFVGLCAEVMKNIPDGSIDAVICDAPYGFPGKTEYEQIKRVLKSGGFFAAFHVVADVDKLDTLYGTNEDALVLSVKDEFADWIVYAYYKGEPFPANKSMSFTGHLATRLQQTSVCIGKDNMWPRPLDEVEAIVLEYTHRGDMVLDPFMGCGTTGVACVRNHRRYMGIDKHKVFVQLAEKNIKAAI